MLMPEVHSCAQMVVENEKLKKVLRKVKRENDELRKELSSLKEEKKISTLLKQYATTRDSEVQTDPQRAGPTSSRYGQQLTTSRYGQQLTTSRYGQQSATSSGKKTNKESEDKQKLNKMMILHNNLMKRYERELKVNMEHLETNTTLSLKVNELQHTIALMEVKYEELSKTKVNKKLKDPEVLDKQLTDMKRERDKHVRENKKLKAELQGLDYGFFEEVEDIKFALQQSAKLNKEYEKCLKKMSHQYGVPIPHPGHALNTK